MLVESKMTVAFFVDVLSIVVYMLSYKFFFKKSFSVNIIEYRHDRYVSVEMG